jgi:hypothetical protein
VVLASGVLDSRPASAVMFTQRGDAVIVTIVNPMVTANDLSQAFADHHLDISVRLIPVSPSEVGTIITQEGPGGAAIQPLATPGCPIGDPSCPITLSISNVQGHSSVVVGRTAQAGELYASSASVFSPGELLHCSGLINASMGEAKSYLRAHNLSVIWRVSQSNGVGESTTTTLPSVVAMPSTTDQAQSTSPPSGTTELVTDGEAVSNNEVMLFVSQTPASAAVIQRLQGGC